MEQLMNLLSALPQETVQALKEKVLAAKSVEDIVALAKELGIDLPAEAAEKIIGALSAKSGELSEAQLEAVAGGNFLDDIKKLLMPDFHMPFNKDDFIIAEK